MEQNDLLHKLTTILCDQFEISFDGYSNFINMQLTGPELQLSAFQMYEYLICIENETGFYFSAEDIRKSNFRTLSDIASAVLQKFTDELDS